MSRRCVPRAQTSPRVHVGRTITRSSLRFQQLLTSYALDSALLARPGNDEIQLDLFLDYASNVALYLKFQEYFRATQTPLLAVWGKNDPFFLPPGAEAFKRDNPNAEVRFYDTGHFALATHHREIAGAIRDFLGRKLASVAGAAQVRA